MKAVVVGGGIAGLAVASGLQRVGWATLVLERSADPRPPRAGLSIIGNGFRALDALGLGSSVRMICADTPPYQRSGIRRAPNGRWLVRLAAAVDRTEFPLPDRIFNRRTTRIQQWELPVEQLAC
ncbi:FAD-dependent oxidoreductase [Mycobacterium conspicuum]|jgi:2-polyprenyl-6-methoxyphenol hydroxylase-like FAD-dependent oxidoreductase|uniref:FAD-binding domain-containing protein n=1 Tax=Mycobacterium conspicuum TaxID=44010 RepID=A0A7I7YLJ7_9MYCO|nr:FAD-dependent monooxygenase [Mycobacterium conspicuum]BBZ41984.1 hypothetical protein MCNS_50470 [Mycobacterium conspicuum]